MAKTKNTTIEENKILLGVINASQDAIAIADLTGTIEYINDSFIDFWGYSDREEILGKNAVDFWKSKKEAVNVIDALFEKGSWNGELIGKRADGSFFTSYLNAKMIYDSNNEPIRMSGSFMDISDLKKTKKKLQDSKQRYKKLLNTLSEGIWVIDEENYTSFVNPKMAEILGYTAEEMIGKHLFDFMEKDCIEESKRYIKRRKEGKKDQHEFQFDRKDGKKVCTLMNVAPLTNDEGRYIGAIAGVLDITERKKMQLQLKRNNKHLEILNSISIAINKSLNISEVIDTALEKTCDVLEADGGLFYLWNESSKSFNPLSYLRISKKVIKDVKGFKIGQGLSGTVAETQKALIISNIADNKKNISKNAIKEGLRSYAAVPIMIKNKTEAVLTLLSKKSDFFSKRDLKLLESIAVHISLALQNARLYHNLKNFNEKLENKIEKKSKELEKSTKDLQKAIRAANKSQTLENLGMFAAGIAHDLNNHFVSIMGNIDLAKTKLKKNQNPSTLLDDSIQACNRAKKLIKSILTFSKGERPKKQIVSIEKIINESLNLSMSGSNHKCELKISPDIKKVNADKRQIINVITNIIINAKESMPKGGIITIKAKNIEIKKDDITQLNEGNYIKIEIKDQGIGIAKENYSKIFTPFFTTKPNGTGIGLAKSHTIIKKHNGIIDFESNKEGTSFYIYLPVAKLDDQKTEENASKQKSKEKEIKKKIMIMDDERSIRFFFKEFLSFYNYEIVEAKNGEEAIKKYKESIKSDPIDLLIMDLTIPGGMGGIDAIKKLKEINENVKAIVSSGYSNDDALTKPKKYGFSAAVAKPFEIQQMLKIIKKLTK